MAGGAGTRLWPFSRQKFPKQFHDMLGTKKTFLQETVARIEGVCPQENIFIVTNEEYYKLVKDQLPFLTDDQILLEPMKRNTAPCVAYATYKIAKKTDKANILVLPADHVIDEVDIFKNTLLTALEYAENHEFLMTLGIQPTRPDTGYGYIQYDLEAEGTIRKAITFTEKPELAGAKMFLASGDFVWNAGIFIANLQTMQEAMRTYIPEIAQIFQEAQPDFYTPKEKASVATAYSFSKDVSMDKGIMEKAASAENVCVVLSSFGWSDLGTWKSIYDRSQKDKNGNSITTKNVLAYDTENSIIRASKDRLVVVQGLKDYIVAEHDGVLMICHIDEEQRVREFVADAKEKGNNFV